MAIVGNSIAGELDLALEQQLALGITEGATFVHVSGRNPDVDAAEDIVAAGGNYTGFLSAASTIDVVSSSASDDVASTGARTVTVSGLGASGDAQSETVNMNGTLAVTTTATFSKVHSIFLASAGTGETNAGTITADDGSDTVATILPGAGASEDAVYSVPRASTFVLSSYVPSPEAEAVVALQYKLPGANGAWVTYDTKATTAPIVLPELTDIKVRALSVAAADTAIQASFSGYVVSGKYL